MNRTKQTVRHCSWAGFPFGCLLGWFEPPFQWVILWIRDLSLPVTGAIRVASLCLSGLLQYGAPRAKKDCYSQVVVTRRTMFFKRIEN